MRDLLADITRPDADQLQASIEDFSAARIKLEGSMEPGWTGLDFDGLVGAGSTETRTVVEDLDAYVNDLYLTYFVHAETIYAAACAITVQLVVGESKVGLTDDDAEVALSGNIGGRSVDSEQSRMWLQSRDAGTSWCIQRLDVQGVG